MTLSITVDGSALTHKVRPSTIEISERAERGNPGTGGFTLEDPGGTFSVAGWRPIVIEESACSQPRLFTGWAREREITREVDEGQFVGSTARTVKVNTTSLDSLFEFEVIRGGGKRPAETWIERLTWILESQYLAGLVADTGHVATSISAFHQGRTMDATDYTGQKPRAVMEDLVVRLENLALDYFAFRDPVAEAVGLFINPMAEGTYDSTLRISNDPADADAVTFAPLMDHTFELRPDMTYSGVIAEYGPSQKRLFRNRSSTADAHIRREDTISLPHSSSEATVSAQAEAWLTNHAGELVTIKATIRVPAASAGLVAAGQRMDVKLTHLATEGYGTFTSMRVVSCAPKSIDDLAAQYDVALELVSPRPAGPSGAAPGIEQYAYNGAELNANYVVTLAAAPTPGNVLVAVCVCSAGSPTSTWEPLSIEGASWTKRGDGNGYDATQYGGPGNCARGVVYTRTVVAGDEATITVHSNSTARTYVYIFELTGVAEADITFVEETGTLQPTVAETISATVTVDSFLFGGWTHQRTNYANGDTVTTSVGTEVIDYDPQDLGFGTLGGAGDPHLWIATNTAATGTIAITGAVATNPNLDKWGYWGFGLVFDSSEDEEDTVDVGQGTVGDLMDLIAALQLSLGVGSWPMLVWDGSPN